MVDVNPGSYHHECYVISKAMIRLLRHVQNIPRETDGAVKDEDIVEEFTKKKRKKFDGASQWSLNDWVYFLAKGGGAKKSFNIACFLTLPDTFRISEQSRDILEVLLLILSCKTMYCYRKDLPGRSATSGMSGIAIDPELQDNVLLPKGFTG